MSLLIWSSLAFSWTFKTVETSLSPNERAYVRHVKKGKVDYWYLIIPNVEGFQVHPVSVTHSCSLHVHLDSVLYGPLVLPIVEPAEVETPVDFLFADPNPFNLSGSSQ